MIRNLRISIQINGLPGGISVKILPENAEYIRDSGSVPELGRSLGGGHGNPVFLLGESHGQRSLAGCSPWGREESDMTEHTHTHKFISYLYFSLDL